MKFTIITLYPDAIKPYLDASILGRAQKNGAIDIEIINLRNFGIGNYKQVDDTPYGGGPGMVLRPDVIVPAIKKATQHHPLYRSSMRDYTYSDNNHSLSEGTPESKGVTKIILLSPSGKQFDQSTATRYSKLDHIVLVCGRFEGFDARIEKYCDEVISVGPYVLSGGEIPALTIVESVARLLPKVLGNELSTADESYSDGSIEYPQYTKPPQYDNMKVPDVLMGGNHAEIANWRTTHKKNIP